MLKILRRIFKKEEYVEFRHYEDKIDFIINNTNIEYDRIYTSNISVSLPFDTIIYKHKEFQYTITVTDSIYLYCKSNNTDINETLIFDDINKLLKYFNSCFKKEYRLRKLLNMKL